MSELEYHSESAKRVTLAWLEVERAVRAYVGSVVTSFSDADDVTQAVAMTMVERFGDYDESRPLLPWVLGIAGFKLKEYIRSRRRDRLVLDELAIEQIEAAYVDIAGEIGPRNRALRKCLNGLSERQSEAFELRYRDDLPPRIVAERMGTSSAAISNLLIRARATLRNCVELRLVVHGKGASE